MLINYHYLPNYRWCSFILLEEETVLVEITNRNFKRYFELYGNKLNVGKTYAVKQKHVPPASRILVTCECDICKITFQRKRVDVRSVTCCSEECRNEYLRSNNPNPHKEKVDVKCDICDKDFKVNQAKFNGQDYFLCSRACYGLHRSNTYYGEKVYNYQNIQVECTYCKKEVKTIKYDLENRNNRFCSPECYYVHRSENYSDYTSHALNNARSETLPETKVREYLEKNRIEFIQERFIEKTYYADFYLPEYNSFIEVYGDYWHVNPEVYGEGSGKRKISELQYSFIKRDNKRNGHLRHLGYDLFFIWEKQTKENLDYYMGILIEKIINKHESATTTRRTPRNNQG